MDWGRVGVEAAIGAIPIPGGGGAAAGREAAATAGREALETTEREAAEQAARTTGERELSTIGTDAAENLGDDTARVAHDACNGAACFTGDTPVLMADGSSKPIQDVQPGDQVTAWDPDTDTTQTRTVTRTWTHENTETLVVRLEDGGQVETTTGHPFLTKDHGWTPAGHLKPGDQLHTPDTPWVTVQSIETTGQTHTVHNLEIEDLHTYHVHTGTTWTTVHNTCAPELPQFDGTTTGVMRWADEDGVVQAHTFTSGAKPPSGLKNYPAASHTEAQAALMMREQGISEAEIFINHPNGMCGMCNSNVPALLKEGSRLRVIPLEDAAPKPYWFSDAKTLIGNSTNPFKG